VCFLLLSLRSDRSRKCESESTFDSASSKCGSYSICRMLIGSTLCRQTFEKLLQVSHSMCAYKQNSQQTKAWGFLKTCYNSTAFVLLIFGAITERREKNIHSSGVLIHSHRMITLHR